MARSSSMLARAAVRPNCTLRHAPDVNLSWRRRRPGGRARRCRRCRRRGRRCGAGGWLRRRIFLHRCGFFCRRRRSRGQLHQYWIGPQARRAVTIRNQFDGLGFRPVSVECESHRHAVARGYCKRARRAAGLPGRGLGLGARRLGLKSDCVHRWPRLECIQAHPRRHRGARRKNGTAGHDCNNSVHGCSRQSGQPGSRPAQPRTIRGHYRGAQPGAPR